MWIGNPFLTKYIASYLVGRVLLCLREVGLFLLIQFDSHALLYDVLLSLSKVCQRELIMLKEVFYEKVGERSLLVLAR